MSPACAGRWLGLLSETGTGQAPGCPRGAPRPLLALPARTGARAWARLPGRSPSASSAHLKTSCGKMGKDGRPCRGWFREGSCRVKFTVSEIIHRCEQRGQRNSNDVIREASLNQRVPGRRGHWPPRKQSTAQGGSLVARHQGLPGRLRLRARQRVGRRGLAPWLESSWALPLYHVS